MTTRPNAVNLRNMHDSSVQIPLTKPGASKVLALVFALVLLVFQSSVLMHSHNGDINKHLDCTFCLQLGTGQDALATSLPSLDIPVLVHRYSPLSDSVLVVVQVPANSRAPPLIV